MRRLQVFARAPRLTQILERHREAALDSDTQIRELRAREEGLTAIREASLAIAHRLSAASYPQEAAAYLYGHFREVLLHDFKQGGERSPNWSADLEMLDDILWILTPRSTSEERARLVSLLPSLFFRLKMGYQRAGQAPEVATQSVEELKSLLDGMARPWRRRMGPSRSTPMPDDYTRRAHQQRVTREEALRGVWLEFTATTAQRRCRLNWMARCRERGLKDLDRNRFASRWTTCAKRRPAARSSSTAPAWRSPP